MNQGIRNVYEQVDANKRKSVVVMVFFALIVAISVFFISQSLSVYYGGEPKGWGSLGTIGLALIFSGLTGFAGYWYSDRIVMAISGARPADRKKEFHFFTAGENLALAAGIPKPRLYVIEDTAPNAFAAGRDPSRAVICATSGLLAKLDRTELEGVIAHELSHIRNYDTRLMSVVTVLVGVVTLLGDWMIRSRGYGVRSRGNDRGRENQVGIIFLAVGMILALLSPIIAQLIQLAISRRREFLADASAAKLTRQPDGLARALLKISADREPLEAANKATAHLYIVNPLKNHHDMVGWFAGLFNTHPPVKERIKQLKAMGASVTLSSFVEDYGLSRG